MKELEPARRWKVLTAPTVAIGGVQLSSPFIVAPMAGMTDTAFRRLVKRHGGCGLVVTEMVSSEGLVRGIDRTLEYAEYTEEERPVSIQVFGGDPAKMADAARIVEGMGADIVDVNMGCPVPKIAKHNAGCCLMREPEHAATVIAAMSRAVKIPVTVKMRAGWDDRSVNAPDLAKRVEDAGAAAVAVHGRTAAQSYSGVSDWDLITQVAAQVQIPVFGSGDCVAAEQILDRMANGQVRGVLVGRGVLRNPWILSQASDLAVGIAPRVVTLADRGQFLLDYMTLLLNERVGEREGFRHTAPSSALGARRSALESTSADGRDALSAEHPELSIESRDPRAEHRHRWVINKLRALVSWYSKGLDNGGHLRIAINSAQSIDEVRDIVDRFFFAPVAVS
jgi:tRNA-dihydrouridine synthase B